MPANRPGGRIVHKRAPESTNFPTRINCIRYQCQHAASRCLVFLLMPALQDLRLPPSTLHAGFPLDRSPQVQCTQRFVLLGTAKKRAQSLAVARKFGISLLGEGPKNCPEQLATLLPFSAAFDHEREINISARHGYTDKPFRCVSSALPTKTPGCWSTPRLRLHRRAST